MLSPKKVSLTIVTLGAGLVLGGGCVAPSPDESLGTRVDEHVIESPWQGDDAEKAKEAGEEAAKETKETGEEAAKKAEETKEEAAEEAKERGEEAKEKAEEEAEERGEEAEEAKEKAAEEAKECGEEAAEEAEEAKEKAAEEAEEKVDQELRVDDPRDRRFDRRHPRDHRLGRDRDRWHRARVCNVRDDFHCERGHRGWRWAWVSAPTADRHGRPGHHDRREGARCCVRVRDHRR